jgi:LuxR family maltose regulon positive regulatory protein
MSREPISVSTRLLPSLMDKFPRHSLMDKMNTAAKLKAIYMHAQTGYGKSTSVNLWLEETGYKAERMLLLESDNSPSTFLKQLCSKLVTLQEDPRGYIDFIMSQKFEMESRANAIKIVDSLVKDECNYVVVMDDLQKINNNDLLLLLSELIERKPDNFLFILISHKPPPDCFARLITHDKIGLIDTTSLRFSAREIMLYYAENGYKLTLSEAGEVEKKTDGWAILIIKLVNLGKFKSTDEIDDEHEHYINRLFKTENLDKLPEERQLFMMKTSILDRMTPEICEKLTGESGSAEVLENLLASGLYINRTGASEYRYQDVFKSFLSKMLEKRSGMNKPELYKVAANHLFSEDKYTEAIEFYVKCEDYQGAQTVMNVIAGKDGKIKSIDRHIEIYRRLKEIIKFERVDKYPLIMMYIAWGAFLNGDTENMHIYMKTIIEKLPQWRAYLPFYPLFAGTAASMIYIYPETDLAAAIEAMSKEIASGTLQMGVASASITNNFPYLHRSHRDYSEISNIGSEGFFNKFEKVLSVMVGSYSTVKLMCIRAGVLMEKGIMDKAYEYAKQINAMIKDDSLVEVRFCAMMILATILTKENKTEEAEEIHKGITAMIEIDEAMFLTANFRAYRCRMDIMSGETDSATDWIDKYAVGIASQYSFYQIYQHFTTVLSYIATKKYTYADQSLAKLRKLCEEYNRPLDLVEISIYSSIVLWNTGRSKNALEELKSGIDIAYEYGLISVFIYSGVEIAGMLQKLYRSAQSRKNEDEKWLQFVRLLWKRTESEQCDNPPAIKTVLPIGIKLARRQSEVAKLIAEGLTNAQIADKLGKSVNTVKKHVELIKDNLMVNSRDEIPGRIKELSNDIYTD